MRPAIQEASLADAAAIAALRTAVAERLTRNHGRGHWSACVTEKAALRAITTSRVLVARRRGAIIATLRLATKKPWAIDTSYFAPVKRAIYLLDMAVSPEFQRKGVGRAFLAKAVNLVKSLPADAIRLDAYDASAGAGPFYVQCGFREVGRVVYRGTPLVYLELLLEADGVPA